VTLCPQPCGLEKKWLCFKLLNLTTQDCCSNSQILLYFIAFIFFTFWDQGFVDLFRMWELLFSPFSAYHYLFNILQKPPCRSPVPHVHSWVLHGFFFFFLTFYPGVILGIVTSGLWARVWFCNQSSRAEAQFQGFHTSSPSTCSYRPNKEMTSGEGQKKVYYVAWACYRKGKIITSAALGV
jgi:hypothetical protein